jgi:hypothetical protein
MNCQSFSLIYLVPAVAKNNWAASEKSLRVAISMFWLVLASGDAGWGHRLTRSECGAAPILASLLRYAPVTALSGPRTLLSPALECRANISGEASPEP